MIPLDYLRERRYVLAMRHKVTLAERLLRKVRCDIATHCWVFTGGLNMGYGQLQTMNEETGELTSIRTHRLAYQLYVGPLTPEMEVHHLCGTRACCNPMHLQPLTDLEHKKADPNWVGNRTHCIRGHPLEGDNIRLVQGVRRCKQCDALRMRGYRAKDPDRKAKNAEAMRKWREKNRDKWNDDQREYRRKRAANQVSPDR